MEYKDSLDCVKKIYKTKGIAGIYKGTNSTILREFVSYGTSLLLTFLDMVLGLYFWVYDRAIRHFMKPGMKVEDVKLSQLIVSGALAGYAFWLIAYPLDLIKTKIQTDSFVNPKYKGVADCTRTIYQQGGLAGFYKGLLPCMLRAGPVNAACFIAFEYTMRILGRDKN